MHAHEFMNNTPDQIKMFLTIFSMQLPTLIVCLVACVLILARWNSESRGLSWALLGFGFVLVLCLVLPVVTTILQGWVFSGGQLAARRWAFTTVSIVSSVLHAASYVFLLVAVLAGRPTPNLARQ
jgi:hypothetical protein